MRVDFDRFLGTPAATVGVIGEEALQLAQRDIDSSRPQDPGQWGSDGRRSGGGDMTGGILGGLVIGSILDGIFD